MACSSRRLSRAACAARACSGPSRASFSGQVLRFVGRHRGVDDDAAETAAASGEAAALSDRSLPSGAGAGNTAKTAGGPLNLKGATKGATQRNGWDRQVALDA